MSEFVSSILESVMEKLASSAVKEIQLVGGVKDDREKLKNKLEMIEKVLADAEQKQTKEEAMRLWLSKLQDFCYVAEDVPDEFEVRASWRQGRSTEHLTFKRKVCYLSSWLSNFNFQFKMAHKMKELRKRLDGINEERTQFNLSNDVDNKTIVLRRETHSFVASLNVIGRNKETESLIELLIRSIDGGVGTIAVIPIIGMGGTGKTTLTKLVYNEDRVKKHFDRKIWLSMLVKFEVKKIIRDIIKSLGDEEKCDSWILEMLQNHLRNPVGDKRCLFVMDDVWEVTREDWVGLRDFLANLSREDSLTLFVNCAFDQGQEKNHPDLMVIGEEIVSKCGGNPLAVKTLGSLLFSKKNYRGDWEYNYEFNNLDLIQLWISNGLIQSSGNNQELEEIGRQYLEELWSRSFFDFVRVDYPFLFFRMHDLIHELAISVAQMESSNMKVRAQDICPKTQHLSFPSPSRIPKDELRGCLSKPNRVRTIMFEDGSSGEFLLEMCISRFKRLRVLWLDYSSFDLLPNSIGSLKHLRFLSSWGNWDIKKLPESIWELRNLQCLDLGLCMELEELPTNIKNMISLRVLYITTKQQRFPEGGIGCLTSLRWLLIASCENLEALFDDIQSLTSLRKLFIVHCPKLASLPQGIKNLNALEDLWIRYCRNLKLPEDESNEPHSMWSLQSIIFEGLPELVSLPRWLEGSASTLQRIKIVNCRKLSELPEWLQNCSSLRTLEIKDCPKLSSLPDGVRRIAALTELQITNCGGIEQENRC
ncbi:hypothetical protein BT93_L1696 [Corymbia citriodora subsp. variegata]|uniref:Disease resistance protein RGA3 n=1 Tax=Corymbia citriodora subsp. variegata TaxID=360336 RepID=A0A8T0CWL8_CORYI|nr:hypothetical protein BT93_L1696 [Corymbia citriodora subsp. variegata]